ncbi:MAG: DUF2202 domain-containing protein [Patescibacteria group bacterium]|jgi:hypothetical protein
MKKVFLSLWLLLAIIFLFAGCAGRGTDNQQTERERIIVIDDSGASTIDLELFKKIINQNSAEGLGEKEKTGLVYLAGEEKMLRDFFAKMAEKYREKPFGYLATAESGHVAAVKILLEKYELADQAGMDLPTGEFADKKIKEFFDKQTVAGEASGEAALVAGLEMIEFNIKDIEQFTFSTARPDLRQSYNLLAQVARNHLRELWKSLPEKEGELKYKPKYISEEQFKSIVDSATEDIPSFRLNLD